MSFQNSVGLRGNIIAAGLGIWFGSAFNEAAALVEGALFGDGEDIVGGVELPYLPHFLNVDFV